MKGILGTQSNKENVDNQSIEDMIKLLQEYEKICLDKQDFSSAEQAKNKISFLKTQKLVLKKEVLENEDKSNIEIISKQGEEEVKLFQQHWEEQLQELIETLKEIQSSLTEQHEKEIEQVQERLLTEKIPTIKYSSQVLELRRYLRSLIKIKNYKEAEIVKNNLETKEKEEQVKWEKKFEEKKKAMVETVKRKQQGELKALRIRLEATFNEKLKERDQKFEILLKKNRKRRIESGKMSRERLRAKTHLLNESKTLSVSKY